MHPRDRGLKIQRAAKKRSITYANPLNLHSFSKIMHQNSAFV